jgi:phosphopantothenoylcysteine decarboxylase/phosphopantothenate--cysteine ligase
MGFIAAQIFARAGHKVTLISGPVSLAPPEGVEFVPVQTAQEMREAVLKKFEKADCVVMTAAVMDFRPKAKAAGKIKRTGAGLTLELVENPDILAELGGMNTEKLLIGFALETGQGRENARAKLDSKNLDLLVLNFPESFGADKTRFELLDKKGEWSSLGIIEKEELARILLGEVERLRPEKT